MAISIRVFYPRRRFNWFSFLCLVEIKKWCDAEIGGLRLSNWKRVTDRPHTHHPPHGSFGGMDWMGKQQPHKKDTIHYKQ